jgi:hypothetical protein
MKKILVFISLIILLGCTPISTRLQPILAPASNMEDSITCCQTECNDAWQRSQLWLVKHSKWKIQTATDVVIQTFNPIKCDVSYGFTIIKEPLGDGCYDIRMELVCGNPLGCDPKPIDVKRAFYYYVKTGIDLLTGQGYLGSIR